MITPSAGMEPAGACHAKKCAPVFAERRWKSNGVWMARTGYVSAAATCACAIAQHPCDRPQVLPAYGLQDLRNEHREPKTKSTPNPMCLLITPGGNRGTGHFYLAKNRTFLLCVDTKRDSCVAANENVLFVQSRNVRFHGWPSLWKTERIALSQPRTGPITRVA